MKTTRFLLTIHSAIALALLLQGVVYVQADTVDAEPTDTAENLQTPATIRPLLVVQPFTHRGLVNEADAGEILADLLLQEVSSDRYEPVDEARLKALDHHQAKAGEPVQSVEIPTPHKRTTRLFVGELSALGPRYYLKARLVDFPTGHVIRKGHVDFSSFDEVNAPLRDLAGQLGLRDRDAPPPPETQPDSTDHPTPAERIEALYLDGVISQDHTRLGMLLFSSEADSLHEFDTRRLAYFHKLVDGSLPAEKLQRALELVDYAEQTRAVEHRRIADAAQLAAIDVLLATAQSFHNNQENGKALQAVEQLLRIDPEHREARILLSKLKLADPPSKIGDTWTNSIGLTFAYIPAGDFIMGSPTDEAPSFRGEDELQHRVKLTRPYLMAVTEVTQAQWDAVMDSNPSHIKGDTHPVNRVDWNSAIDFCKRLSELEGNNYRLPTEAEWEYACRAGNTTKYYIGPVDSTLFEAAWFRNNSLNRTHPVMQKKANPWGLYDMHGNVFEWCADWHNPNTPRSLSVDPKGAANGTERVLRGGSYLSKAASCRSAYRGKNVPENRLQDYGFRVVLELTSEE